MLSNTAYCLSMRKNLTVGYIGGSVTAGFGASNAEVTSWRARTTQWLRETFPAATVAEGNAAVGGTGSFLGMCRIGTALLGPYHPNLIFIEYAINDYYQGCSMEESGRQMESMVRQCLSANPYTDIVLIYTTDCGMAGRDFDAVCAFEQVARHYGLYTVNVGRLLREREGADALRYQGQFLTDSVHPNDAGYEWYAAYVTEFLATQLAEKAPDAPRAHCIPAPLYGNLITAACPIGAAAMAAANPGVGSLYDETNYVLGSGEAMHIRFCGGALALWWRMATGGQVMLTLDGESSALPVGNPDGAHRQLYAGLSNGEHILTVANTGAVDCSLRSFYVLQ